MSGVARGYRKARPLYKRGEEVLLHERRGTVQDPMVVFSTKWDRDKKQIFYQLIEKGPASSATSQTPTPQDTTLISASVSCTEAWQNERSRIIERGREIDKLPADEGQAARQAEDELQKRWQLEYERRKQQEDALEAACLYDDGRWVDERGLYSPA